MNRAKLLYREKRFYAGGVVEMVVWQVSAPVLPSTHAFKYRLAFVQDGKLAVGYDNERGKRAGGHNTERPDPCIPCAHPTYETPKLVSQ